MDFSNKGGSVYHRLYAIYLRTPEGKILRAVGSKSDSFKSIWPSIQDKILEASTNDSGETTLSNLPVDNDSSEFGAIDVLEQQSSRQNIVGIAIQSQDGSSQMPSFDKFFAKLMVSQSSIDVEKAEMSDEDEVLAQKLTDLFDSHLRFEGREDKWLEEGREYFVERVRYFVSRSIRLDACLPAFPCKSSNPEKVTGEEPDKGEELALRRLHDFVQEVEKVYQPGAQVWIISDGHVFSDCIGVDDSTVDSYGQKLQEMNQTISTELGSTDRVCFRSLVDIFDLRSHVDDLPQLITELNIPEIDHHVTTEHTDDAEISRRILMAGCAPDPAALRARIDSNEKSIIALYRGFSRFMLEDLDFHPSTKDLTKKKRKKLASSVSFEMIQRNQAYSNLVEMIFPDHLRLSIHAHNNSGPKFGIQLFDREVVRATNDLKPDSINASSDDLLHIPTPWHNCVAQVAGDDTLHVVKSKVVEEALDTTSYDGGYVESDLPNGQGGFFSLKDLTGKVVKPVKGEDEVVAKSDEFGSSASSSSAATNDSSSVGDASSETDASSVEDATSTQGKDAEPEKATNETDTVKDSVEQKTTQKKKRCGPVEADEVLNLACLRHLGLDPDTLQELRDMTTQWVEARLVRSQPTSPVS